MTALASAFTRLWLTDPTDPQRGPLTRQWADGLRSANTLADLVDATQEALERRDGTKPERLMIYLDQGEELYTRAARTAPKDAARFSQLIAEGLRDPRLIAFGSLRADYFDRLQTDEALFSVHELVNVPPLSREQLAEVVSGPPAALGVSFEDARLPDRIVDAAASEPGALPLLSYLLTDMWSAMVAGGDGILRLPLRAIEVGGVLAARAEEFLAQNPAEETALKRLLTLKLALVPPEGEPVRRQARRSECSTEEWALAERLADHPWRLVVIGGGEQQGGEVYAEVAHEALLRAWPRLEGWLRDERTFLVFKAEVERAERRWAEMQHADRALLAGLDLARAEEWLPQRPEDLSPDVRGFIQQSIALDRTTKMRALRFQRRVSAAAVLAAIVLAGIGGLAVWQWIEADRHRATAEERTQQAVSEATKAAQTVDVVTLLFGRIQVASGAPRALEELDRDLFDSVSRAANGGNPVAATFAGILAYYGQGTTRDFAKARIWWEQAAAAGNSRAMNAIGLLYADGEGVPQDYSKARHWYEKAATAGSSDAMVNIGLLFDEGRGVPQDGAKALDWYEKAAAAGNSDAMHYLGILYANGQGVPQNETTAQEWYKKAAAIGNSHAMNSLGFLYDVGQGVTQDDATAREWYEKAASLGNGHAMNNLGYLYDNGKGVPQDSIKAREWYEKAAESGSGAAMSNLGVLYANGEGVPRDYLKAREWYEKGAAAGESSAMRNIGILYANGQGVTRDDSKAREWQEKADAKARKQYEKAKIVSR
jgi:TPR repeat protein